MIRFQQIRNATVKLCYPNATFLIDPWLSPTCTPEERDAALHEDKLNGNQNETKALCAHTPLEINLLGMRLGRYYPDERFWAIAGEVGNTVVLGCDAHKPEDVCGGAAELEALRLVKKYSLRLRETITLRQL